MEEPTAPLPAPVRRVLLLQARQHGERRSLRPAAAATSQRFRDAGSRTTERDASTRRWGTQAARGARFGGLEALPEARELDLESNHR